MAKNVIESRQANASHQSFFAPKKKSPIHSFVDSWKLNAVTIRQGDVHLWLDQWSDSLGETKVFSTFYDRWQYWQMELGEHDSDRMELTSHRRLHRLTRMPFGLNNVCETFWREMYFIFTCINWKRALIYLFHTVSLSKSLAYHVEEYLCLLRLLYEADDTLK